jgi:hypothetical protein
MSVSPGILVIVVAILLAAAAGTFALAFGLGGREGARALNAGRFIENAFNVGQTIGLGELNGQLVAIEPRPPCSERRTASYGCQPHAARINRDHPRRARANPVWALRG